MYMLSVCVQRKLGVSDSEGLNPALQWSKGRTGVVSDHPLVEPFPATDHPHPHRRPAAAASVAAAVEVAPAPVPATLHPATSPEAVATKRMLVPKILPHQHTFH